MSNREYDKKKLECWKQFCKDNSLTDKVHISVPTAFAYAFDRAYALGKQEKYAEGEEMLTVPRKAIIQAYKKCCDKRVTKYDVGYADCLYNLFGSKCLPDTEPILQPFSQAKETAASTIPVTEFDKLSKLKDALLKLEEASKQVREELTKLNEK